MHCEPLLYCLSHWAGGFGFAVASLPWRDDVWQVPWPMCIVELLRVARVALMLPKA